jgi:predicted adenylyl cyclase CyaB
MANSIIGRYEVELKIRIEDPEQAKQRVLEIGAIPRFLNNQEHDLCFDYADGFLSQKQKSLILRSREPFGQVLLFIKGVNDDVVSTINFITVSDLVSSIKIVEELGLVKVLDYKKTRSMYLKDDTHIVVDTIEGIGHFLEIGSLTSDPHEVQTLKLNVELMLQSLGYCQNERISESYRDLVRRELGYQEER